MRAVEFGISVPQFFADGEFDPEGYRTYFARAEELGFDSAWAQEQVLGAGPQLSALETMTYAAACTQRLRLGCAVFVSTLHNPVHLAKSLATLDQLSRGRIEVGVGTGGKMRPFAAFGVDPERYVARFTEGIALMKALWTEPRVTFDGDFWQLRDAAMEPKPFQKPFPPLWFGGSGPAALRRADPRERRTARARRAGQAAGRRPAAPARARARRATRVAWPPARADDRAVPQHRCPPSAARCATVRTPCPRTARPGCQIPSPKATASRRPAPQDGPPRHRTQRERPPRPAKPRS